MAKHGQGDSSFRLLVKRAPGIVTKFLASEFPAFCKPPREGPWRWRIGPGPGEWMKIKSGKDRKDPSSELECTVLEADDQRLAGSCSRGVESLKASRGKRSP